MFTNAMNIGKKKRVIRGIYPKVIFHKLKATKCWHCIVHHVELKQVVCNFEATFEFLMNNY